VAHIRSHPASHSIQLLGSAPASYPSSAAPLSLEARIRDLGDSAWPLADSDFQHAALLVQAISRGDAFGASDGSYMPHANRALGTAAWGLKDPTSETLCAGLVRTSGQPSEVNAYRSELQGLHTLLLAVFVLCQHWTITEGRITLACDNEKAISLSAQPYLEVPCTVAHADLIRGIRRLIHEIPIKVILCDVAGHRDDHVPFVDLTPMEQLNCQMDEAAQTFLRSLLLAAARPDSVPPAPTAIYGEGTSCTIHGVKITSAPDDQILDVLYASQMREHLHTKAILHRDLFFSVDWDAIDRAMRNRRQSFQTWMTKHISGQCAVGRKMHLWGYWDSDACPCCGVANETVTHFPFCTHPSMRRAYSTQIQRLAEWMTKADTDPAIQTFFLSLLESRGAASHLPQDSAPPAAPRRGGAEAHRLGKCPSRTSFYAVALSTGSSLPPPGLTQIRR